MLAMLLPILPRKYPLGFTLRFLLGLILAALPGILWHPQSRILLGLSGVIFLLLCAGLLIIIKPLTSDDLEMVGNLNKKLVPLLAPFAREK